VTPTSQIVGTQAVLNVIAGERYKMVPNEVKNYLRGYYGRSPAPIDPAFLKKILGEEKPIDHRPADDLEPILPTATDNLDPKLIENEEDILSYCLFPEPSLEYFKWRSLPSEVRPKTPAEIEFENIMNDNSPKPKGKPRITEGPVGTAAPVLNDSDYEGISSILEKASLINLNELSFQKGDLSVTVRASGSGASSVLREVEEIPESSDKKEVQSPTPEQITKDMVDSIDQESVKGPTINAIITGTFYSSPQSGASPYVKEDSEVNEGETVCLVEAMKLFNEITAPFKCKILKVLVNNGDPVTKDQPLMVVEKL
jgi:oxaloacetate decarboxylase alpha subunit